MPCYEFRCEACGRVVEVIQPYAAAAPECVDHEAPVQMTRMVSRFDWHIARGGQHRGESVVSRGIRKAREAERRGKL